MIITILDKLHSKYRYYSFYIQFIINIKYTYYICLYIIYIYLLYINIKYIYIYIIYIYIYILLPNY